MFGSFIIYFIADGVSLSFGIFSREFIIFFDKANSQSSVFITAGLIQAVPLFLSPLTCILIEKYGCRSVALVGSTLISLSFVLTRFFVVNLLSLNLIMGLMLSSGLAMCYIPAYLIISFHFTKRRALATGIAVSGSGLGLFIVSPLLEYLILNYGWIETCFIFGAISSHTFISACLFRPADNQANNSSQSETEKQENKIKPKFLDEISDIYRNKKFIIVNLAYFFLSFVVVAPHNFLPSHVKLNDIDDPSSLSISLMGISALAGQIIMGYISDKFRSKNWFIFSVSIILSGVVTCVLPLVHNIYFIYAYSIAFGFLTSVNYVLQSSLVIESLGLANLTLAFGCLQLCQGFSTLLGTPMLSWFKDNTKNYDCTFYITGLILIISGIILLFWPLCRRKRNLSANQIEFIRSNKSVFYESKALI